MMGSQVGPNCEGFDACLRVWTLAYREERALKGVLENVSWEQ